MQSFTLIFVSEIGDKTFILVTIYAAKMPFCLLFVVSSIAMMFMHTLSTLLGTVFTLFIPKLWTQIAVIALFWIMGTVAIYQAVKQIRKRKNKKEGISSSDEEGELKAAIELNELEYKQSKQVAVAMEVAVE